MRIVILLVLAACVGQAAAEGIESSAATLISSQNIDGSWGVADRGPESQIYITAKVLEALTYSGSGSGAIDRGVSWVELEDPQDTAALSTVIGVLSLAGELPGSYLPRLEAYQNMDGGWGKDAAFKSTPWYTSTAVIALNSFERYSEMGTLGGEYLLGVQNTDGDFEDSALITSNCIYALVLLYNTTKREDFALAAIKGYGWLNRAAGDDGAWGSKVSTANSVIALDALYSLTYDGAVRTLSDDAKRWIIHSPENKSDFLSTALDLTALTKDTGVSPAKPDILITAVLMRDHVFPSEDTEARFTLKNRGITNLKNLSLYLTAPKEFIEIKNSEFQVHDLPQNSSRVFTSFLHISEDAETGEYPITVTGDQLNLTVLLYVLRFPLLLEINPTELKNGAPINFELTIKNQGQKNVSIENVSLDLAGSWRDVEPGIVKLDIPPGSTRHVNLFSATTPEERGEYFGIFTVNFVYPDVGWQQLTFDHKFLVSGAVPSGVLKLVLYGTLVLSVMMLLNLLVGYDLLG